MQKRNSETRRDGILALVSEREVVSVEELARIFETSEVTIRKDLTVMEEGGFLLRRYGGATLLPGAQSPGELDGLYSEAQHAIAKLAATLISDHSRIVIDSGSTTAALIPLLKDRQGLVVMTNSLRVANAINRLESEPTLLMTGGTWDAHSNAFQGQIAENVLRSFDFDQLFIGADGVDLARGTTTFNELVGLSRVMAEVSRQVVVLVEMSKFGRRIPNLELPWDMVDILVTDRILAAEQILQIESNNVCVMSAETIA